MNSRNSFCYSSLTPHHKTTWQRRKTPNAQRTLTVCFQRTLLLMIGLIAPMLTQAQPDSADPSHLTLSGSVDIYYAYYHDSLPGERFRVPGLISPRSEQFGLNIAQARLAYDAPSVRGRLALHYGDIPLFSWSPDFPMLQEGTFGVRVFRDLWIDGGFFPTHIGTESFLPGNNRLGSVAAITFYEPLYQSGVRIGWEGSETFTAQLHLLSGYNAVIDRNNAKGIGAYVAWHPSEAMSFIYTNLFGDEAPDSAATQFRTYHNVQLIHTPISDVHLILGFDFCSQSNTALAGGTATMTGGLLLAGYDISPQWRINGRFEFFNDPERFMAGTYLNELGEETGLELWGGTLGAEYKPTDNSYIKLEGRMLQTPEGTTFFGEDVLQRRRFEAHILGGVTFDAPLF